MKPLDIYIMEKESEKVLAQGHVTSKHPTPF